MKKLVAAVAAAAVLATPAVAEAKGGTGQVSVFATTTSCNPWTLQANLTSTDPKAVLHVDVSDDSGPLYSDIALSYLTPVHVPIAASGSKDTIRVYLHNSLQEFGRYQAVSPC